MAGWITVVKRKTRPDTTTHNSGTIKVCLQIEIRIRKQIKKRVVEETSCQEKQEESELVTQIKQQRHTDKRPYTEVRLLETGPTKIFAPKRKVENTKLNLKTL